MDKEIERLRYEVKMLSEVDDEQRQYIEYLECRMRTLKNIIRELMEDE